MVKPEWGMKRACLSCATRFYDLNKKPPVCPKCGATVEITIRGKRAKAEKHKDLEAEVLLGVDIDFSDSDVIVDEALMVDEEDIDDALDEIEIDER